MLVNRLLDGMTDCHMHVFDGRFPWAPEAVLFPDQRLLADYRVVQASLGIQRHVLVQPSSYGTDNRLMLEQLQLVGGAARGIAVVRPDAPDPQLEWMAEIGVRGLRFNLAQAGATTLDMIRPLSERVAHLGWHIQVHAPAAELLAASELWTSLPCPVVFDHLARIPQPSGLASPHFEMVAALLREGKAWVKLSALYMDSLIGPPSYADTVEIAAALISANPNRILWGTDWPHVTEPAAPSDANLLALLPAATGSTSVAKKILVDNPAELYGFPKSD